MITKIFVTAANSGDGSATISFYDDIRVANWQEEHDCEGFAEPTVRTLEIESDGSKIKIKEITTAFQYYLVLVERFCFIDKAYQLKEDLKEIIEFKKEFENSFPKYHLENGSELDDYKRVNVIINGCLIDGKYIDGEITHTFFVPGKASIEEIAQKIEHPEGK